MPTSRAPDPTSLAEVLSLLHRDAGQPCLTWYGPDLERVELSGAVLVNWVNKTTNLLVEEFDAAPGTTVLVDLPPHWRSLVWSLAVWRAGAALVTDGPTPDVVVTSRPQDHGAAHDLVAVALPALARGWPGTLPPGAIDAAAAVMTYGDTLGPTAPQVTDAPAVSGERSAVVLHRDLLDVARSVAADALGTGPHEGARALLPAEGTPHTAALRALGAWALRGSVVLVAPDVLADDARLARILTEERVTTTMV